MHNITSMFSQNMYRLNNRFCSRNFDNLRPYSTPIPTKLGQAYKPHEVPIGSDDYFYAKPTDKTISILLPPPNITGNLHLGHALTCFIQDALVRWYRMNGVKTVWVPGLDHAGIATQVVVEKHLYKSRGMTRQLLGREKFIEEVNRWKNEKTKTITEQLEKLNLQLNWDKQVFTMDQTRSRAVNGAFIKLFEDGLVYRADLVVNWSPTLQSAISDMEVDHCDIEGPTDYHVSGCDQPVKFGILTKFAYKLVDSDEEIVVATSRPETIFGDVAVAVHPNDERFAKFVGRHVRHPFTNATLPVIADSFVRPDFGTGAVKITPAHDPIDFQVGKRHNLSSIQIFDQNCNLSYGKFAGKNRFEVRHLVVEQLGTMQLFRGTQPYKTTIPICSRSKDIIEFLIKPQWFLDCKQMAQVATNAVRTNALRIEPKNFEKIWFEYLDNIRDWCISRQLWWGHRIPAFCHNGTWRACHSLNEAADQFKCSPEICRQDEDVLDTWFSSALLPFSSNAPYPLSLMVTGHDILFFWVARMVMLGHQLTGQLPFNEVFLHGIICDVHGRKMSKSLGNVISPDDVIKGATLKELNESLKVGFDNGILTKEELQKASAGQRKMFPNGIPECGADALRFTLLSHNARNNVISFDVNECHTNQLFGNKIWQATKFTLMWMNPDGEEIHGEIDEWILSRLNFMLESVEGAMESREFHLATARLKNFLYYEFCDTYLEAIKSDLKDSKSHSKTLVHCLNWALRSLSPFMPQLAQHLHKHLPVQPPIPHPRNVQLEEEVERTLELITAIRRLKKYFNVTYKYQPEVYVAPNIGKFYQLVKDLCHLYRLHVVEELPDINGDAKDSIGHYQFSLVVPTELRSNLDVAKLNEKLEKLERDLLKCQQTTKDDKKIAQLMDNIKRVEFLKTLTVE